MEIVDSFEKIIKPGLWLVRSRHPMDDVSRFVYEIGVELGQPLTVLTFAEKEIKNEVFSMIRKDCLESASNELDYNWLEQELSEYNTHGFLWHPEELNDYLPNGSFWSYYVRFDDDGWLSLANCDSDIVLVDDAAKMWWEDETDISRILYMVEKDAIEKKKTIFVFASPNFLNLCL